jgi:hypothetical protein
MSSNHNSHDALGGVSNLNLLRDTASEAFENSKTTPRDDIQAAAYWRGQGLPVGVVNALVAGGVRSRDDLVRLGLHGIQKIPRIGQGAISCLMPLLDKSKRHHVSPPRSERPLNFRSYFDVYN